MFMYLSPSEICSFRSLLLGLTLCDFCFFDVFLSFFKLIGVALGIFSFLLFLDGCAVNLTLLIRSGA